MANILEFLRGVLIEPDAQRAFRADPAGHLERSGFGDLTGEDVVEGIAVLRRSLPADLAGALDYFEDEDFLPPVRPSNEESELDAAVRVLGFAVDQVPSLDGAPGAEPAPAPAPEPEPEPEAAPELAFAPEPEAAPEVAWSPEPEAVQQDEPEPEPEPERESEGEPEPEPEADGEPAPEPWAGEQPEVDRGSGAVGAPLATPEAIAVDVAALPSVSAFAESLAAVATDARTRSETALQQLRVTAEEQAAATRAAFDAALADIVAQSEAAARETAAGYEDLLRRAEADANGIRAEADAYAAERRREADGDREAARQYLERTRQESDDMLERSRQQAVDARQQADDLLAASRAEAEAARAEIDARRAEMREAERQLKERLSGIDSLFRTVLRDDEGGDAADGE